MRFAAMVEQQPFNVPLHHVRCVGLRIPHALLQRGEAANRRAPVPVRLLEEPWKGVNVLDGRFLFVGESLRFRLLLGGLPPALIRGRLLILVEREPKLGGLHRRIALPCPMTMMNVGGMISGTISQTRVFSSSQIR